MSSLERLPSDETDDGNVRLTEEESDATKNFNPGKTYYNHIQFTKVKDETYLFVNMILLVKLMKTF